MTDRDLLQAGYRYALSLAFNHHDAEDLVQEAWVRVSRLHGSVEHKSLLYVTIRNIFIDQYRRKNLVLIESLEDYQEAGSEDVNFEFAINADQINVALHALRVEEREVIFLNAVEGYTAQEIAGLTKRSRNTILSLMHRGKKKLVALLCDLQQEGKSRA